MIHWAFFSFFQEYRLLSLLHSNIINHSYFFRGFPPSAIPGRPPRSSSFLFPYTRPSFLIPAVCGYPPQYFLHPTVLSYTPQSSDSPYSPPHNPGRHAISPAVFPSGGSAVYLTTLTKAYRVGPGVVTPKPGNPQVIYPTQDCI